MLEIEELDVDGWRRVARGRDAEAGLDAIISVHDATLGPGCGGCRIFPYADAQAALADVKRLSRGMTFKNALAGIPFGGGKAVIIADPKRDKTPALIRAYGRFVDALGGLYYTAEDSGVSERDISLIQEETAFAAGRRANAKGGNPSPFTARGVWRGMQAAAKARFGDASLAGRSVSILGVGAVGRALAGYLSEEGAKIIVADVDPEATAYVAREFDAAIVDVDEAPAAEVDIYAPCALGGAVNADTIDRIRAKIVAGAANNQLATPEMDEALRARGILYAPDYVINAAGVISVGLEILDEWSETALHERIDSIASRLLDIFARAEREQRPTGAVADAMAFDVIAAARERRAAAMASAAE